MGQSTCVHRIIKDGHLFHELDSEAFGSNCYAEMLEVLIVTLLCRTRTLKLGELASSQELVALVSQEDEHGADDLKKICPLSLYYLSVHFR